MTLALHNVTAQAAEGRAAVMQTLGSRTRSGVRGQERRGVRASLMAPPARCSYCRRDKKQMFHKSSLSRFIK